MSAIQYRPPRDVDGNSTRFVRGQHLGLQRLGFAVSRVNPRERLSIDVTDDIAARDLVGAMVKESGGWSWPWPSSVLDDPKDQLRCFGTRHHPANLFRRYRRHHFVGELETFAERHTGSQTPHHSDHASLEHRRRFDDDAPTGGRVASPKVSKKQGMRVAVASAIGVRIAKIQLPNCRWRPSADHG